MKSKKLCDCGRNPECPKCDGYGEYWKNEGAAHNENNNQFIFGRGFATFGMFQKK